jgi:hypothetical protein
VEIGRFGSAAAACCTFRQFKYMFLFVRHVTAWSALD